MSKYGAKKCEVHGIVFDSTMEAEFYLTLFERYDSPDVRLQPNFELQPSFKYQGETIQAITYQADFMFNGIVYEVKGFMTHDAAMKLKMFKYKNPELIIKVITKSPKKYLNHALIGEFIEVDVLKRLRKEGKSESNKKQTTK